jgi:hypothetical protein
LKSYCVYLIVYNLIIIQTNLKIHLITNKLWQCPDAMQRFSTGIFSSGNRNLYSGMMTEFLMQEYG